MISDVPIELLAAKIQEEHPHWTPDAARQEAADAIAEWDSRLGPLVRAYVCEGKEADFGQGEFSIATIRSLRRGRGYLDAIALMDAYLKDPLMGKARILRR